MTEKSETKYKIARVLKLRVNIDIENRKARACDPPLSRYNKKKPCFNVS